MLKAAVIIATSTFCALPLSAWAQSTKLSDEDLNALNTHVKQIQRVEKLKGFTVRLIPDGSNDQRTEGCIVLEDGSICCGSRAACGAKK